MNRKSFIRSIAALSLAALGSSVVADASPENVPAPFAGKKILVACFSWSGNTKAVAETIRRNVGGDFFEIVPATPYPREYRKCTEQAKKEIAEKFRPALKSVPENLAAYDVVFVGSPNWWGTFAPPVSTFLDDPAFAGKTVVPFFTHGGGGMQNCERDMREKVPAAKFLRALTLPGSSASGSRAAQRVNAWLREIATEN